MVANRDTSLTREFMFGPCDGLVMDVPADAPAFYLTEVGAISFGHARGWERFCHVYVPDGGGRFYHVEPPIERLTDVPSIGADDMWQGD